MVAGPLVSTDFWPTYFTKGLIGGRGYRYFGETGKKYGHVLSDVDGALKRRALPKHHHRTIENLLVRFVIQSSYTVLLEVPEKGTKIVKPKSNTHFLKRKLKSKNYNNFSKYKNLHN